MSENPSSCWTSVPKSNANTHMGFYSVVTFRKGLAVSALECAVGVLHSNAGYCKLFVDFFLCTFASKIPSKVANVHIGSTE